MKPKQKLKLKNKVQTKLKVRKNLPSLFDVIIIIVVVLHEFSSFPDIRHES